MISLGMKRMAVYLYRVSFEGTPRGSVLILSYRYVGLVYSNNAESNLKSAFWIRKESKWWLFTWKYFQIPINLNVKSRMWNFVKVNEVVGSEHQKHILDSAEIWPIYIRTFKDGIISWVTSNYYITRRKFAKKASGVKHFDLLTTRPILIDLNLDKKNHVHRTIRYKVLF